MNTQHTSNGSATTRQQNRADERVRTEQAVTTSLLGQGMITAPQAQQSGVMTTSTGGGRYDDAGNWVEYLRCDKSPMNGGNVLGP